METADIGQSPHQHNTTQYGQTTTLHPTMQCNEAIAVARVLQAMGGNPKAQLTHLTKLANNWAMALKRHTTVTPDLARMVHKNDLPTYHIHYQPLLYLP